MRCCFLFVALLGGCSAADGVTDVDDDGSNIPANIIITPSEASLSALGETVSFSASVVGSAGNVLQGQTVEWSVTNPDVAEISTNGTATATGQGVTDIVVTSSGMAASAQLRVDQSPTSLSLVAGDDQDGFVGEALPELIVVAVLDSGGSPIPGVGVRYLDVVGGSEVDTVVVTGGTNGGASFSWVLGPLVGKQQIRAEVDGLTPIPAIESTASVALTSISAGAHHTCGLSVNGRVYCWGLNQYGALGGGSVGGFTVRPEYPAQTDELFSAVSVGAGHTCALTEAGEGYCWGRNTFYQLGDGTDQHRSTPTQMIDGLTFDQISAGGGYNCGVTLLGEGYCWGEGALGNSGPETAGHLRKVSGEFAFSQISAGGGSSTCGVSTDGKALCWGELTNTLGPVEIGGLSDVVEVSAGGEHHSCARTASGDVYCWGDNEYGALGDGTSDDSPTPVRALLPLAATSISTGNWHSCAQLTDGSATCWGDNFYGQLGDGTTTSRLSPTPVTGSHVFFNLTTALYHVCGLTEGGLALCWGWNELGQVGDGTLGDRSIPTEVLSAVGAHSF